MKKFLIKVGFVLVPVLMFTGCTGNGPNVRQIEQAMRDEFVNAAQNKKIDPAKYVILSKVDNCETDKEKTDVFVCVVFADEKMIPSADGKTPAKIRVAVKKENDKWVTVDGVVPEEGKVVDLPSDV